MRSGFRVDAGPEVGYGHFFRCLALANAMKQQGHDPLLIVKHFSAWAQRVSRIYEIPVLRLEDQGSTNTQETLRLSRGDANATLGVTESSLLESLFIDHYGIGQAWVDQVRTSGVQLIQIADKKSLQGVDWILDYGFDATLLKHDASQTGSRTLLGPSFFPFLERDISSEPEVGANSLPQKPVVLVALGSGLGLEIASQLLDEFKKEERGFSLEIAGNSIGPDAVNGLVGSLENTKKQITNRWPSASFGITAGGVSMYERIASGVPGVVVQTADNQQPSLGALKSAGLGTDTVIDAKNFVPAEMIELAEMATRETIDQPQSCLLKSKVDHLGAHRVIFSIDSDPWSLSLSSREFSVDDAPLLLRWANDSHARNNSSNTNKVKPAEHLAWIDQAKKRGASITIYSHLALPCGQVRLEPTPAGTVLSYSVDPIFRRRGIAGKMLEESLARTKLPSPFLARVHKDNAPSAKVLLRLGFIVTGYEGNFLNLVLTDPS